MGNSSLKGKPDGPKRVFIDGLYSSGKTTLLYRWKLDEVVPTYHTMSTNYETITYKDVSMVMSDYGGRDKSRPLLRLYLTNTDILVYVVDSSDHKQLDDAKYELHSLTKEEQLKSATFLILANKQDMESSYKPEQIAKALELHKVKQKCHTMGISALTGEGLNEALEWITTELAVDKASGNLAEKHSYSWKARETMKKWLCA